MIKGKYHAEGVVLRVRAQPGARRNQIVSEWNGALKIAVTAPADQGKANQAICNLLAELMGLKEHEVELLSGATSRAKKVLVRRMSMMSMGQWLRSRGLNADN